MKVGEELFKVPGMMNGRFKVSGTFYGRMIKL